jgi:hypothetical protein
MALLTKFGNDDPKFLGKLKLWDDPFFCVFDPMAVPQEFIEMLREKNNIQNFHQFVVFGLLDSKSIENVGFLFLVRFSSILQLLSGLDVLDPEFLKLLFDRVHLIVETLIIFLYVHQLNLSFLLLLLILLLLEGLLF